MNAKTMGFGDEIEAAQDDAKATAAKAVAKPKGEKQTDKKPSPAPRKSRRRKSERTLQLNLKVTPDFYDWLEAKSQERGEYMVETLEALVKQYGEKLK